MRAIHQRYDNDCGVAAVAMVTGLYYGTVLNAAIEIGFVPDNGIGLDVCELLDRLGFSSRYSESSYGLEHCEPRIAIIKLDDRDGGGVHALVVERGVVYDPDSPTELSQVGWLSIGMVFEISEA